MTDNRRLREIQNKLVKHIQSELKDDEDFMYLATMLLKHSIVLYRTFLEEEQIRKMLDHVGKTMNEESHSIDSYVDTDNNPPTMHQKKEGRNKMEALLIIGALAAGAHYITKEDDDNVVHSSQTTTEISRFHTDAYNELNLANIDWSKAGNSIVGDSSENGVQWIFITN